MKKWLIARLVCASVVGGLAIAGQGDAQAQTAAPKKAAPKAQPKKATGKTPAKTPAADPQVDIEPSTDDSAPRPSVPATPTEEDQGPVADPNIPDSVITRRPRDEAPSTPPVRYDKSNYPDEIVRRPLTLAGEQAQISVDVPFVSHDGHPT